MATIKKWMLTSLMTFALVFVSFTNTVHITFAEGKTATLAIVGESQKGVILCPEKVSIEDGETAYSLLQKVMGTKVTAEDTKYGVYVKGIDGLMAGDTSGWTYDVNDQAAMVGADSYKLESGDVVAFRFVVDWNNMSTEKLQQVLDKIGTCKNTQGTEKPEGQKPEGQKPEEQKPEGQKPEGQKPEGQKPEAPKPNELLTKQLDRAIAKTSKKMMEDGIDSDWVAIALARSGYNIPTETKISYLQSLTQKVEKRMGRFSATDTARTVLAISAVNGNPTNVAGKNLVQELYQSEKLNSVTGYTFALLALDTKKYEVPVGAKWNRAALVKEILQTQHTDGGWTYNAEGNKKEASSVDVTGMVLSALSPYQKQPEVKRAVEKAVKYLSSKQLSTGGFEADGQENSNSVAQAIIGLAVTGVDPTGKSFTKNHVNAVQNLISYQLANGEFKWLPSDKNGNSMATEQAFLALVQYRAFVDGKGSIYDWTSSLTEQDPLPVEQPKVPKVDEKKVIEKKEVIQKPQKQTNNEKSQVVVKEKTVNNEQTAKNRQLPQTGGSAADRAMPLGMGVLCIISAYVLWRRKAA
ncbi:cell wall anchor protein [Bacillus cereus]|uniref:Cell wall anchor protein n=1 Tax=Bacillus cereus TaxID=1396 RepID=A0A2B0MP50_BACCE|nr:cell wall anchor protein [Bacillus cereus]